MPGKVRESVDPQVRRPAIASVTDPGGVSWREAKNVRRDCVPTSTYLIAPAAAEAAMREANDPEQPELTPYRQSFCLTNLSTASLIGGALAVSALLWLGIWAVL